MKNINIYIIFISLFLWYSCNGLKEDDNSKTLQKPVVQSEVNWIGHWLNEGRKEDLVREIANEFEFQNQELKVNLAFPEDLYERNAYAEYDFVISQLKKSDPDWDIIRLYGGFEQIGQQLDDPLWIHKYLVNFKDVPGFMESQKDFINSDLYHKRTNNFYYSPYIEGQMAALFVNLEVAKKVGIEVKQFDMTYDDFLGYIKAVNEYNKKNNNKIVPYFEYNWLKTKTLFNILFYSLIDTKEEILNEQLTTNKVNAIKKCLEAFEELSKFNVINKDWNKRDWVQDNSMILDGGCLFFPNLTLMHGIWMKNDPEKLKNVIPCEFPVFKPSKAYIGGYVTNWVVLKNSPRKDAAIKLMMEFCKPEVAEKWVRYSKSPSGVKGNLSTSSFGIDPFEDYTYTVENKYELLLTDDDRKYVFGLGYSDDFLPIQDVLTGKITADDAFNDFLTKVTLPSED